MIVTKDGRTAEVNSHAELRAYLLNGWAEVAESAAPAATAEKPAKKAAKKKTAE